MTTNSELLLKACRENPECGTALSALQDAFQEEGDEIKVGKCKALIRVLTNLHDADRMGVQRAEVDILDYDRLQFQLGLTWIGVGDEVTYDQEGRAFPLHRRNWGVRRPSIGRAVSYFGNGLVEVRLFSPGSGFATTLLEVSR